MIIEEELTYTGAATDKHGRLYHFNTRQGERIHLTLAIVREQIRIEGSGVGR